MYYPLLYDALVTLFFSVVLFYCMRESYDDYPRIWTAISVALLLFGALLVAKIAGTF